MPIQQADLMHLGLAEDLAVGGVVSGVGFIQKGCLDGGVLVLVHLLINTQSKMKNCS
jgi:hypothetical protein